MALDRIINKVIDKNSTLLDLTNDTVNENRLLEDITAHNSEGEPITGRYDASDAEAWARGTRYGIPVSNTDETYHNNALFYAGESENYTAISGSCMNIAGNYAETAENQAIRSGSFANIAGLSAESAEQSEIRSGSFANIAGLSAQSATDNALKSEGFATGKQNGTDVESTSPYYHNNAEYFKDLAEEAARQAGGVDMTGATATTDGTHGLIKQPHAGDQDKFFKGDGTWAYAGDVPSSMIALVESTNISAHAYAIGNQFIYNKVLYTATSVISVGDEIVTEGVNANCVDSQSIIEQIQAITGLTPSNAIKNISRSGTTFTATRLDDTTFTFDQQDNNTWTAMTGATSSANGKVGYVGATPPSSGYNTKYWRADGTWNVPTNTWTALGGASSSADGTAGYAPKPTAGQQAYILRGNAGWASPQTVRNSMGLGNTTGALPVANGGTGVTTEASLRALALNVTKLKDAEMAANATYTIDSSYRFIIVCGIASGYTYTSAIFVTNLSGNVTYSFNVTASRAIEFNLNNYVFKVLNNYNSGTKNWKITIYGIK